jgi:hypothetical protein
MDCKMHGKFQTAILNALAIILLATVLDIVFRDSAFAHVITVIVDPIKIVLNDPAASSYKITIGDHNPGDASQPVSVTDQNGNSLGSTGMQVSANGSVSPFTVSGTDLNGMSVTINGQTFAKHVIKGKKGTTAAWITDEEAKSKENTAADKDKVGSLPFADDSSTFADNNDILNGQFLLLNNSNTTAYEISDVQILTGIPSIFFTSNQFDSAAAIAAGTLFYDQNAEGQSITILPHDGSFNNQLAFAIGQVDLGSYSLLTGIASPILSGGTLGSPTSFSKAINPVAEPTSLWLVLSGMGMLGLLRMRSSRKKTSLARICLNGSSPVCSQAA